MADFLTVDALTRPPRGRIRWRRDLHRVIDDGIRGLRGATVNYANNGTHSLVPRLLPGGVARSFSERLPVVVWGPTPPESSSDRPRPDQHVLYGGLTEDSLARTLADRSLLRQRRQRAEATRPACARDGIYGR